MPGLFELIYKNREHGMDNVRWSLLKWMFDLDQKFADYLGKMAYHMTSVILTIHYLLQVSNFPIRVKI